MPEPAHLRTMGAGGEDVAAKADKSRKSLGYPEVPPPIAAGFYDNHTHFDFAYGDEPLHYLEQLSLAEQAGARGVVQVGVTLESSKWSAALAAEDSRVLAAVALHPNEAPDYRNLANLDAAIAEIAELATQPRVRAIGETGLDFFRTEGDTALELQRYSFEEHIRIAKENDIALMIHDRDAHAEVVDTLLRVGAPDRVVFHCYSGDVELAEICNSHGWYMSFAGNITIKRNQDLRDSILAARPELRLIETDAPFLSPEPYRGRPNASYLIPITLRFMAGLVSGQGAEVGENAVDALAAELCANTERVYGAWK